MSRLGDCGHEMHAWLRADARYCSNACRQRAYRERHRSHRYQLTPQYQQACSEWREYVGRRWAHRAE